jgi:hypothetical protein
MRAKKLGISAGATPGQSQIATGPVAFYDRGSGYGMLSVSEALQQTGSQPGPLGWPAL